MVGDPGLGREAPMERVGVGTYEDATAFNASRWQLEPYSGFEPALSHT